MNKLTKFGKRPGFHYILLNAFKSNIWLKLIDFYNNEIMLADQRF